MMPIDKLIRKFGSVERIPDAELGGIGLVRYKRELIRKATWERIQREERGIFESAEDKKVSDWEYREPEPVRDEADDLETWVFVEKFKQAEDRLKVIFSSEFGRNFPEDFRARILTGVKSWVIEQAHEYLDDFDPSNEPRIAALEAAMDAGRKYIASHGTTSVPNKYLARIIQSGIESGFSQLEELIEGLETGYVTGRSIRFDESEFKEAEEEVFRAEKERIRRYDVPEQIKKEFQEKYGPIGFCGGGPFFSYAFRREVLCEEEPKQFWGMRLFELRKKFLEQFKNVPNIESFAEILYDCDAGLIGENLFKEKKDYGIDGLKALTDNLPSCVEEFEDRRQKGEGAAIAYINTESCYCVDDDLIRSRSELRQILIDVRKAEHPEIFARKDDRFSFLEGKVSEGKKTKLRMLASEDDGFMTHIQARAVGENYVDKFAQNQATTQHLQKIGVNTEVFYNGIAERSFVIIGGKKISREELRKENLQIYRESLERLLVSSVMNSPDKLEQKLIDAITSEQNSLPKEKSAREYILSLDEDELIRRVCNTAAEYASRVQNISDSQTAGAIVHHLRDVSRFLRGDGDSLDEKGNKTSHTYTIRTAKKDPFTDVDIGNDGGCCIGIYGTEYDDEDSYWTVDSFVQFLKSGGTSRTEISENGIYMPFYLKDRATHFAEIRKGADRIGMALMFAGENERGEPVLAVNSIEMSQKLREDTNRNTVRDETIEYLRDYARGAGFKHLLLGEHHYNPGRIDSPERADFEQFIKIDYWEQHLFYSDILHNRKANARSFAKL